MCVVPTVNLFKYLFRRVTNSPSFVDGEYSFFFVSFFPSFSLSHTHTHTHKFPQRCERCHKKSVGLPVRATALMHQRRRWVKLKGNRPKVTKEGVREPGSRCDVDRSGRQGGRLEPAAGGLETTWTAGVAGSFGVDVAWLQRQLPRLAAPHAQPNISSRRRTVAPSADSHNTGRGGGGGGLIEGRGGWGAHRDRHTEKERKNERGAERWEGAKRERDRVMGGGKEREGQNDGRGQRERGTE